MTVSHANRDALQQEKIMGEKGMRKFYFIVH
jgi:hypothetical protein